MKTLTAEDLVIGGKYVPHSKSWYEDETLEDSDAWRGAQDRGQSYLYYTGDDGGYYMFWYEMDEGNGDYFLPSDVTPYIEPGAEAKQYEAPATLSEFESDDSSVVDPKEFLPFNLEEALKAPERVVYRNGEKPLEWHWFKSCTTRWSVSAVAPDGRPSIYDAEGYIDYGKDPDVKDLMLLPLPKKKYWVNVMEEQSLRGGLYVTGPWESEAEAFNEVPLPDKLVKTITFEI